MKKLWLGATLAAITLLCARPAAAQIGIVSVTGGRKPGRAVLLAAVFALAAPAAQVARGADAPVSPVSIVGIWQGTLDPGPDARRIVLRIRQDDTGAWQATMSNDRRPALSTGLDIQDPGQRIPASSVLLHGTSLQLAFPVGARYTGTVSADGKSIQGEWTQGRATQLTLQRVTAKNVWSLDPGPVKTRFVSVEPGVRLEVLDWGGQGPPVILLAGLGNTAHVFDRFAARLARWYHVYGITRRGFGASSAPAPGYPDTGYSVHRLGDDVVAVMDALKIQRPVLAGHSIAGQELSDVGSRHPDKIAGLVYLDAASFYAFYDTTGKSPNSFVDYDELRDKLSHIPLMLLGGDPHQHIVLIDELLATDLPRVRQDLETWKRSLQSSGSQPTAVPRGYDSPLYQAIFSGHARFTSVGVPLLAIFSNPFSAASGASQQTPAQVAEEALFKAALDTRIAVVQRDAPQARIVRLSHADHYIFVSNEDEVLEDVHRFIQSLPAVAGEGSR